MYAIALKEMNEMKSHLHMGRLVFEDHFMRRTFCCESHLRYDIAVNMFHE